MREKTFVLLRAVFEHFFLGWGGGFSGFENEFLCYKIIFALIIRKVNTHRVRR